mgnify:CR=1 FL=1
MTRHPSLPRYRRLLAVAGAALAVLAVGHATPAAATPAAAPLDPLTMVSDDGTVTRAAPLRVWQRGAASGFAGTGLIGTDGAEHGIDPGGAPVTTPGLFSVIGTDGRQRQDPTTGSVPARSTVQLTYTTSSGSTYQFCSGWLFGPDTVITAGHCVYDTENDVWASSWGTLRAWPGRNGSTAPYGSCTVRSLHSVTGWTQDHNRNYDVGALKLNCTVGNTTGWLGVWWTTANLVDTTVYVRGYPCDQTYGTQWWDADVITSTSTNRLFYTVDTYNCQSGSPVYDFTTGDCTCALAIHTTGSTTANGGTRITQAISDRLFYWRNL